MPPVSLSTSEPKAKEHSSETSKRFRFKRKHGGSEEGEDDRRQRHRHRHHRRRHRSHREQSSHKVDGRSTDGDPVSGLPADVAFRESLFDALADDEGADYWQSVYGQPIHTFPNAFQNEETGELERMDDEEYAAFVRHKMWEKSWEGIEAAKEQKRKESESKQKERKEEARAHERQEASRGSHDFLFDLEIEKSLARGKRRRNRVRWKALWQDYLQRWSELQTLSETRPQNVGQFYLRDKIPWPVESGKHEDLDKAHIETFLEACADAVSNNGTDSKTLTMILKAERVRFHPDKVQQRYGFMEIDSSTMQRVTAVFQILDQLWNESRGMKT